MGGVATKGRGWFQKMTEQKFFSNELLDVEIGIPNQKL